MGTAITIDEFRRLATRQNANAAGLSPSMFHRWKRGKTDLTLTNTGKLAAAMGMRVVAIGTEDDISSTTAPQARVATAPVAAPVPTSPPACACVQAWLRAQAELHAAPAGSDQHALAAR
jgi:hypothetical protein